MKMNFTITRQLLKLLKTYFQMLETEISFISKLLILFKTFI